MKKWRDELGIQISYRGTTSAVPLKRGRQINPDEHLVIGFARANGHPKLTNRHSGVGGIRTRAMLWSNGTTGAPEIVSAGVVFRIGDPVLNRRGFGPKRFGTVVLHELGHAAGLGHARSNRQMMGPGWGEHRPTWYTASDRAGFKKIGGTRGCFRHSMRTS